MRLRNISLQHFRNVELARLVFEGRQQFLLGRNGQGKTNLLEAAGCLTALRSFRTTDHSLMVAHGQHAATIACELDHEQLGETSLEITLRAKGKDLKTDGARVTRLADHLGKFPTVVFSSQDLLLVRGAPTLRRRWLDLTLAAMDAAYLRVLQTFSRALAERNMLLKRGQVVETEIVAFERELAPAAAELIRRRREGMLALDATFRAAYAKVGGDAEVVGLSYAPNFAEASADALLARLASGRARDAQFRTTLSGPHRDDFAFSLRGDAARDFASEGQQRTLVLALRVAQAAWFHQKSGVRPILLADDVLGELDPERRARFWASLDPEAQVIATGTSLPDAELGTWQVFRVEHGKFNHEGREGTRRA